ncbi:MAG: DUF3168 domain-containing protein [Pseudomonadota bacterium]
MSAQTAFGDALLAALEDHGPLADAVNAIDPVPAVRATVPYLEIGPIVTRDWSTKTERGRELRFSVSLFDQNERAARLADLMAEAEAAIAAMPRELADWQVVSCVFLRGRIDRTGNPWTGILEFRARLLAM